MPKVRISSQLADVLDKAIVWRKRELSSLRLQILSSTREHQKMILRRVAIPLLYAHWEGFVKAAATYYLEFVSRQRLPYEQLKTNFIALSCQSALKQAAASEATYVAGQMVDFLLFNQGDRARVPFKNVVDTKANLNSEVLRDILYLIGLEYSDYWIKKELLLDGSLLKTRNEIAHGRRIDVDKATYEQLHDLVMEMLDALKAELVNSAITGAFRRAA